MRLIVFSDTHGRCSMLPQCVRRTGPDMIVHLGDHMRDTRIIEESFPEIPLYAVPGNCDFSSAEDTLTFSAGGVLVFATHGHRYGVKSTMDSLLNSAHFAGAQLVLYGHTHIARIDYPAGMTVVNPGSSGLGSEPSFAQIDIREGGIAAKILPVSPKDPYM